MQVCIVFPTAGKDKKSLSVPLLRPAPRKYIGARQGWRSVICVKITWKISQCNPSPLLSQRLHTGSGPQRASELEVNKRDHPTGGPSTGTCLKRLARYSSGRNGCWRRGNSGRSGCQICRPSPILFLHHICGSPIFQFHAVIFLSRVVVLCQTPPTLQYIAVLCSMSSPSARPFDLVTSSPAPAVYPEHSSPYSERDTPSASAAWDGRSSTTSVPLPQRQVVVRRVVRGVIPSRTAITGHPDQNHRTGTGFRNLSKLGDGQLLHRRPRCSNHVSPPHTRLS